MKRKPIRVDWEALEDAFNNFDAELVYHLDRVTGRVALEGEGEEGDDDEFASETPPPIAISRPDTFLEIRPPDTATKIVWLKEFLATDAVSSETEAELRQAMVLEDAATRLRALFAEHPEERERWYAYRSERIREMIVSWLAENEVETVDSAPWQD